MSYINQPNLHSRASLLAGLFLLIAQAPSILAEEGYGDLSGEVIFVGEVPVLKPLVEKGDRTVKDAAICAAQTIPDERLVVDPKTKGVANVFVYLKKAPAIHPALIKTPQGILKVSTTGCRYEPHALVVRTGQKIEVNTQGPVHHNVHECPLKNPQISQARKPSNEPEIRTYRVSESLPMKVFCDFHFWMSAWWLVVDHPYAAVTDAEGKFKIEKLPAGTHEFVVWHESVGYVERKLTVKVDSGKNTDGIKISLPAAKLKLPK